MLLALRAITCNDNLGAVCCSYNSSLLRGGSVGVKPYDGKSSFSAMRVLVDARYCEHHRRCLLLHARPVWRNHTDMIA